MLLPLKSLLLVNYCSKVLKVLKYYCIKVLLLAELWDLESRSYWKNDTAIADENVPFIVENLSIFSFCWDRDNMNRDSLKQMSCKMNN